MKTPKKVKKWLDFLSAECTALCHECTWKEYCINYCELINEKEQAEETLAYIQQLESDLQKEKDQHQYTIDAANVMKDEVLKFEARFAQAEQERDAALQALHDICSFCKGHCLEISGGYLPDCEHCMIKNYSPDNTKEADRGGETTAPDP